jgi:hypothetical protein
MPPVRERGKLGSHQPADGVISGKIRFEHPLLLFGSRLWFAYYFAPGPTAMLRSIPFRPGLDALASQ